MATREQLLAWGIRKTQTVELGDGVSLTIRQMNATELTEAKAEIKDLAGQPNENLILVAAIICRSAINEDGTRIFSSDDMKTIAEEFSYERLEKLVEPVFRLNGILKEQSEQTEKN